MSDGPLWSEPAPPDFGVSAAPIPVTGVNPRPLPLPPGTPAGGGEKRNGARIALIVITVVVGVLALCIAASLLLGQVFLPGFPGSMDTFGQGVVTMQWAGSGRYAVVEYASSGADATASVIAWDSATGMTKQVDGFRLVSVEPSSTELWLTRAVDPDVESFGGSPWAEPAWGPPESDGPGTAWTWDAALGGSPVQATMPRWKPWAGSSGRVADLRIDPTEGLWPNQLEFSTGGSERVAARVPEILVTFLPVGWSPSGRYFAVRNGDPWAEEGPLYVVFDSVDGSVSASFSGSAEGAPLDGPVGNVAWDPVRDTLWTVRSDAIRDGEAYRIEARSLDATGTTGSTDLPAAWRTAQNPATVIGTSPDGVLVGIEGANGIDLWRVSGRGVVEVEFANAGDLSLPSAPGLYSVSGGLLVSDYSGNGFDIMSERASVVDLHGGDLRRIWPQD